MPGWIQALVAVATFLTTVGIIWKIAIRPGARIISQAETTIPLLAQLTKEWHDTPALPAILKDIADHFQDPTLKDSIVRLEAAAYDNRLAAEENKKAAIDLNMQMEVNRALADNDRRIMDRLVAMVNVLDARVQVGVSGVADIQTEQGAVAADLRDAHGRADRVTSDKPGEAADAAAKSVEQ